jgi:hypothetical protein
MGATGLGVKVQLLTAPVSSSVVRRARREDEGDMGERLLERGMTLILADLLLALIARSAEPLMMFCHKDVRESPANPGRLAGFPRGAKQASGW